MGINRCTNFMVVGAAMASACSASAQQFRDQTGSRLPAQSYYSNQLSVCDVDGDGDLDFVVADGQGYTSQGSALKPRVYINDGAGFFTDETDARISGVTGWFRGVEFGDCDGDGDWDMLLAQDFNERPLLLINNGSGYFSDATETRMPDIRLSSARGQFGDVDGDGDLDIALCDSGTSSRFGSTGKTRLFLNDGTGHYFDVTDSRFIGGSAASQQMDVLFFDADNDLDLDLYLGTRASGTGSSRLWTNGGTGYFSSTWTASYDYNSYSYDAGDLDGDADLDLVGANAASTNREKLIQNNGDGSWTDRTTWITPNPSADDNDSKFCDVDNDGDLDLIIAVLYGSRERIYINNGSGLFQENTSLITSVSDATLDIAVADFSGDGKPDIVTVQGEGGSFQNRFYLNTGPADTRAPRITVQEIQVPADESAAVVLGRIEDSYTSDRGFDPASIAVEFVIGDAATQEAPMRWVGNSIWRADLAPGSCGSELRVRIIATDRGGNTRTGEEMTHVFSGLDRPEDVNNDGIVDGGDLSLVLGYWGPCPSSCAADINEDGQVDGADLTRLLGSWGGCL